MKSLAAGAILVAVGATASPPALAQDRPAAGFAGAIEVRLVNLEVVVVDRENRRVSGLQPEQFRLLVDGEEVPIEYFTEIRDRMMAPLAESAALPPPAVNAEPDGSIGTNYLVFIDEFFSLPSDRDRVLEGIEAELGLLERGDRIALVAFDGEGLETVCPWTGSRDAVRAGLDKAFQRQTHGYMRLFESRNTEERAELRRHVQDLKEQVGRVIAAAAAALRTTPLPDGRRAMILLSGGWPLDPAKLLPASDRWYINRHGLTGGPDLMQPLIDTANLLGYSIYAADVPGLEGTSLPAIDDALTLPPQFPEGDQSKMGVAEVQVSPAQRERENQFSLRLLARETGGQALINTRVSEILSSAVADTRSYYWLGFSPEVKGDNVRHGIRVEVNRADLEVRSRRSLVDMSEGASVSKELESTLLTGAKVSGEELIVHLGQPQSRPRGKILLPVEISIPLGGFTALPSDKGLIIELELRFAATDEEGRTADIPLIPIVFRGTTQPRPGSRSTYRTTLELRRTTTRLLISIHDPLTDTTLTSSVEME